jgi:hypothetical protein
MKISFILGDWARNIGNAFFQVGGLHVLNTVLPNAKISIIGEQPGYPSYWNPRGGNPANYFDMAPEMDTDLLVLMGPMLRPEMPKIWGNSLEKLLKKGTKLMLLGVAAMNYEKEHISTYREFFKKYPPDILTSRDTETYQQIGDLAKFAYDGIDLAFFLPEIYQPVGFASDVERVVLNFDKIPEPEIQINVPFDNKSTPKNSLNAQFEFNSDTWFIKFPKYRTKLASRSRQLMFLEGFIFRDKPVNKIGQYDIIRTDHRPHPMISRKTYRGKNVFTNDTPYPYLEIYSQGALTLSNRIHGCVAAMCYGKPAMLFSSSPRVRMLERLGLQDIINHPVYLDTSVLRMEKGNLIAFLREHLPKI